MSLASRGQLPKGPALGRVPIPLTATVVSAIIHGALAAAVVITAGVWSARQPKTYVINLVPAVAAVGEPRPAPALPARPEAPPPPPRPTPSDLPAREAPRPPAEMPPRASRDASALPDRALPEPALPDPALPSRAPALPRPGDKELPAVASATTRHVPAPMPAPARTETAAPPPPPPPPGQPAGSAIGAGALTLNISDFPFAWYLSAINRKITTEWSGKALPGGQPVAVFDIGRTGQVIKLTIEKTSGNPYYDQMALRAITAATPFPPLPEDFKEPFLRVHLGFNFTSERG